MILAVIPCKNESEYIGDVVKGAIKYCDEVLVIDNLSTDDTIIRAIESGANVRICAIKGTGAATNLGLEYGLAEGYDIVVTLDGDGQHNPEEIPQVVKPILDGQSDFVIGTRFNDYHYIPRYRRAGIDAITLAYNLGGHQKYLHDGQSGFRAYSKNVLKRMLPLKEKRFEFSVETLIKARSGKFRISEVPISCIYHNKFENNSSMNPIRHGLSVLLGTIKWRFKMEFLGELKSLPFNILSAVTKRLVGKGLGRQVILRTIYRNLTRTIMPESSKIVTVNDCDFKINTDKRGLDGMSATLVSTKEYEPITTKAFKTIIKQGMNVIDIGANLGYYSLLSSKLVGDAGKVWAVEPEPYNLSMLRNNIAINHMNNVTVVAKAISDKNGTAKFYVSQNESGEHSLINGRPHIKDTIDVEVARLDDIIKEKVDFIKVDVEGNEIAVLNGAENILKNNNDIKVITEVWFPGIIASGHKPYEVWDILLYAGFKHFYILDEINKGITYGNFSKTLAIAKKQCDGGRFSVNLLSSRSRIDELER